MSQRRFPSGTYPKGGLEGPADPQWVNFIKAFRSPIWARSSPRADSRPRRGAGSVAIATMRGYGIAQLGFRGSRVVFILSSSG